MDKTNQVQSKPDVSTSQPKQVQTENSQAMDIKRLQELYTSLQKHPDFKLDLASLEALTKTHEKLLSDKNILANLPGRMPLVIS